MPRPWYVDTLSLSTHADLAGSRYLALQRLARTQILVMAIPVSRALFDHLSRDRYLEFKLGDRIAVVTHKQDIPVSPGSRNVVLVRTNLLFL